CSILDERIVRSGKPGPLVRTMRYSRDTGVTNRRNVAMIRAAASAKHRQVRHALAQTLVALRQIERIAGIEFRGFIELRVALRRRIGAQSPNAPGPFI